MVEKQLLIVEDDRDFSESLRLLLQIKGFSVKLAASGEEALDLIHDDDFFCVLMDIKLPGISGIETLEKIVAEQPGARVLLMTGCERGSPEAASAHKVGAHHVLYKPFRINDLLYIINKLL